MGFTRRFKWGLVILLLAMTSAATGVYFAAQKLQSSIEQALGPNSEVGALQLHWNGVEIDRLRIKAAHGWPAEDELRATRIRIEPDLRGLLTEQILIRSIEIDGGYMSLLRTADGRLRMLPSLLEKPRANKPGAMPTVRIGHIELNDAAITFYDASIRKPPLPIRTENIHADIDDIHLPSLTGRTAFDVSGTLKGVRHDGTLVLKGWAEIASKDSETRTRLRGVDLIALQPYLIKATETGVRQGTLDLDIDATVKTKQLKAPGMVTLHDLELDPNGGGFMGMPRRTAVSMMQDKQEKIVVKFELNGNIDDPAFSLNENIATRFGSALADSLGVSVEGVARGAGAIGGAVGAAAEGAGRALKGLFGN